MRFLQQAPYSISKALALEEVELPLLLLLPHLTKIPLSWLVWPLFHRSVVITRLNSVGVDSQINLELTAESGTELQ